MNDKFITRIALAAIATLVLAFALVEGMNFINARPGDHASLSPTPKTEEPRVGVIIRPSADQPIPAPSAGAQAVSTPPAPNQVTVADLKGLAAAVHLTDPNSNTNKQEWKLAMNRAQAMTNQGCDCEEKYWLNQFVEAGNQALSGSDDYAKSVKLLVSLPKNDDEATTHQISGL